MAGNKRLMTDGVRLCNCERVCVSDVRHHSHLQDSLELLQFGFLLLDLTIVVLAQFDQQQAGNVQDFLKTQRHLGFI